GAFDVLALDRERSPWRQREIAAVRLIENRRKGRRRVQRGQRPPVDPAVSGDQNHGPAVTEHCIRLERDVAANASASNVALRLGIRGRGIRPSHAATLPLLSTSIGKCPRRSRANLTEAKGSCNDRSGGTAAYALLSPNKRSAFPASTRCSVSAGNPDSRNCAST